MMRIAILSAFVLLALLAGTRAATANTDRPTLIFDIDQGFGNGVVVNNDQLAVTRIIRALKPLRERYNVCVLLNPMLKDRTSLDLVLDTLAAWRMPFVFDVYSSDGQTLGSCAAHCAPYDPRHGQTISLDDLRAYKKRYGQWLAGMRIMEVLAEDFTVRTVKTKHVDWLRPCTKLPDDDFFQPRLIEDILKFARENGMFVEFSDWHWIEFATWDTPQKANEDKLVELFRKYPKVVTVCYANNEPNEESAQRLDYWEKSVARFVREAGVAYGLNDQSWLRSNELTCPVDDIIRWAESALAKGCTMIQFEPAWYLFKLPRGTFDVHDYTTDPAWSDRGRRTENFDKLAAALMREPSKPIILSPSKDAVIVDVTEFGAAPNDGKDDTTAVRAALAECAKQAPATLVFPRGRYDFTADPANRGTLLPANNIDGLTIDGGGSEFVVDGLTGFMSFGGSRNVCLRNFSIDWKRPPFSFGKVEAVEGNHFDVRVEDRYPVTGGEPVGAFMDYDPKTRLPVRHGLDEYYTVQSTELAGPQLLRVNLNHPATIKPGVNVLLRHQVYGYNAFYFLRCENVRVENVNVYTTPGMALLGWACTNFDIKRLNVVPRPRSGRPMSATADAVHLMGTKGHINMTDCTFDGMGDDAANIGAGLYLAIKEKVDDRTVLAGHNLKIPDPPDVGDTMELRHQEDMLVYGTAKVAGVEQTQKDGIARISFTEPLPSELEVGDAVGNASRVAKTRISNCTVRNNRARGFLIQTRDAAIEKCTFTNCTSGGVWAISETVYFCEAIGARDVVVRNCTFDNCNYGGPLGDGVLCSYAILSDSRKPLKPGIHKNIVFENNTIRRCDNSAIFVSGTDGITIRNNTIEQACEDPTIESGHCAIHVISSGGVKIEGNNIDPTRQGRGFATAIRNND